MNKTSTLPRPTVVEIDVLLKDWVDLSTAKTNRLMSIVGLLQWLVCIVLAITYSPWTWIGETAYVHLHCWIAIVAGGALALFPIWVSRQSEGLYPARMLFTVSQISFSVILIHLTGGRIETHFHVFGSMALLSLYSSSRVLIVATGLVLADHFLRGVYWPQSVFGVWTESPYRWMEHAVWLAFMNVFLGTNIVRRKKEMKLLAERQNHLESLKNGFQEAVRQKTHELQKQTEWFEQTMKSVNVLTWSWQPDIDRVKFSREWDATCRLNHTLDSFCSLMHPEDATTVGRDIRSAIGAQQNRVERDLRMMRQDGSYRWYRCIGEFCHDPQSIVTGIMIDIHDRKEGEIRREQLQQEFAYVSHKAGMAEVAMGVLHNVGNGLNSVNTSAGQLSRMMVQSRMKAFPAAAALLGEQGNNLPAFFASDPRGQKFVSYLDRLAVICQHEREEFLNEIQTMQRHVEHVRHVIQVQQRYASRVDDAELINLNELVSGAVETTKLWVRGREISLSLTLGEIPITKTCRHSILQVLYNLFSNAIDSISENVNQLVRTIEVSTNVDDRQMANICVRDSGIGFTSEQHQKMFQHGFTTKKDGHGFGLHICALIAKNLGGELVAESPGAGKGATFRLSVPVQSEKDTLANKSPCNVSLPTGSISSGLPTGCCAIQIRETSAS